MYLFVILEDKFVRNVGMHTNPCFNFNLRKKKFSQILSEISRQVCNLYSEIIYFGEIMLFCVLFISRVRIWDVAILIPNCLFLLFLLVYIRSAIAKLKASSSPIFTAFFVLVSTKYA